MHTTCNALSRTTGEPCKLAPVPGKARCKFHGGKSTGPRTEEGKQAARENGKKGGRPRIHPAPMVQKPKPMATAAAPKQDVLVPQARMVKCGDCEHYSAAYHCRAAERGELGPGAQLHPSANEPRQCTVFHPWRSP